jgi:hypothetical protein
MSAKLRSRIKQWWPAIVVGAGIAETIYLFIGWQGISGWSWYTGVCMPLVGGVIGYSAFRGVYGVYKSLCAGRWIRITCWTVFSALLFVMMGIMAKHFTPNDFPAFMPNNLTAAYLIWGALGAALTLVGLGEEYLDDIDRPKACDRAALK